HVFFIERSAVGDDMLKRVARALTSAAVGDPPRYDVPLYELAGDHDEEAVRAVVGHLARAGVVQPAPSAPDRLAGRVVGRWDRRTLALCRSAAAEGTRVRWGQYRAVWSWVEDERCRRAGILRHFGDRTPSAPHGPCCDVCDPSLVPEPPAAPVRQGSLVAGTDLEGCILGVVSTAQPPVGRTRAVE